MFYRINLLYKFCVAFMHVPKILNSIVRKFWCFFPISESIQKIIMSKPKFLRLKNLNIQNSIFIIMFCNNFKKFTPGFKLLEKNRYLKKVDINEII